MTPEQARARMRMRARLRAQSQQSEDGGVGSNIGAAVGQAGSGPMRSPSWRAEGVADLIRGGPSQQFQNTYQRRQAERAPRGRPGTFVRALEDFNRNGPAGAMSQMWRNLGVADEIAGAAEWLRSGGNPEAARAGMAFERDAREQVAREQPGLNTASIVASVPATMGNPASIATRIPAIRAGLSAAGIDAPFALARQEGSLQERLPGAAQEMAAVAAFGTLLQGGANRLTRNTRAPTSMGVRAQMFEDAGVRPTFAAVSAPRPSTGVPVTAEAGGGASITKAIAENPIAGIGTRVRLRGSLADTARGSQRLARAFAPPSGSEEAGQTIQVGLRRWAHGEGAGASRPAGSIRNWSFDRRADALYQDFEQRFSNAVRQNWTSRGQAAPAAVTDETSRVLGDILGRNTDEVAAEVQDDILRRFQRLTARQGAGEGAQTARTFQDLRDLRSYVRNLQRVDPSTRPTLSDAALQRLEGALTQDIYTTVMVAGGRDGETLARRLLQTDKYYRRGNERIRTALRPFLRENTSPAQAYGLLVNSAGQGGRQNIERVLAVRRSLQPDEWRVVVANVIDEMGRARSGHPFANEGAFSVSEFATRYNNMSREGRRALFGSLGSPEGAPAGGAFIDLERAMDNLANVAGMQKAVERAANTSNSAVAAQSVGTLGGLVTSPQITIPILAGLSITGEMLTNPAFVKWLTSAARVGAAPGGMRRQIAALATIAARDPAIAPLHAELVRRVSADSRGQEARPRERSLEPQ